MSQLKQVKQQLSFIFGKKPIVYFVSEDVDFIDMLFEYDPNFCPIDLVCGEKVPVDKTKYIKENYNSSSSAHWCSLINEHGDISNPPPFKGNPKYCYIKNFNYIFELNNKSKEYEIYCKLMQYVSGYNMLSEEKKAQNILVLSGTTFVIPDGLAPFVEVIDVPYPDEEDIVMALKKSVVIGERTADSVKRFWRAEAVSMKGFTNLQINDILKTVLAYYPDMATMQESSFLRQEKEISRFVGNVINEQKLQMVKKNGVLQFIDYPSTVHASGCGKLETFIEKRRDIFLNPKKFPGVVPPKGILFAGVPGTGKSLMAKKIASLFGVPLLKMDMGSLMGKYMGESESKLRRALKMAESVAPCVLFIDEFEKAFSTGEDSHETSKRMFGYMLGWMQDCKKSVFIYATANHINRIDGAFLRSGRFDSKFFAFMPNRDQCVDIFLSCLEKRASNMKKEGAEMFDGISNLNRFAGRIENALDKAARDGRFLNGADIDSWISICITALYNSGKFPPYSADDFFGALEAELKGLNPYGKTNVKELAGYWLLNKFNSYESSDSPLFPYEDFDLDRKKMNPSKDKREEESYFVKRDRGSFLSDYDYGLYRTIVDAVDKIPYMEIRQQYMSTY